VLSLKPARWHTVAMPRPLLLPILCSFLAACGPGENDPGPGGVTVGEAKALDEAAAMLDAQRSPVDGTATMPAPLPPSASATPAPTPTSPN
jgi:hypothetical protein